MALVHSRGFFHASDIHNLAAASSSTEIELSQFMKMKDGAKVYVCNSALQTFIHHVLPLLTVRFILLSGDSDNAIPFDALSHSEFHTLVSSPLLIHWWCQNLLIRHPRISHLPIGLDYHTLEAHIGRPHPWGMGCSITDQEAQLQSIANAAPPLQTRTLACYSNFHHAVFGINTRGDRQELLRTVPHTLIAFDNQFKDRCSSWIAQSRCAFVLSPRGGGYDCHRTWEALVLGCIPIVKSSGLDPLFDDLPVLIVQEWSDVTAELLQRTRDAYAARTWNREKLYMTYWLAQINAVAQN
jgi:hypothetical protein